MEYGLDIRNILWSMGYIIYNEYSMVQSKIMFFLFQEGCSSKKRGLGDLEP